MGQESGVAAKLPRSKVLLVAAIVVVLIAIVAVAVQRELAANKPPSAAAAFTAGIALSGYDAPPLTAEEEAYAAAMWPIHSEVKLAAVRMIFAGLNYKTEDRDTGKLKSKVQPLTQTFLGATRRVNMIVTRRHWIFTRRRPGKWSESPKMERMNILYLPRNAASRHRMPS
jgi:hypothetical protein